MTRYEANFIAACWLVFLLWWLVAAVTVKRTVASQGRGWFVPFGAVALVLYVSLRHVPGVADYAQLRLLPDSVLVGAVADLLAFVGLAVMLWARVVIGRNWSGGVVLKEDHEIATKGPYAYVRHPIYTGLLTLTLGTAVAWGTVAGFACFVAFALGFWYKSRIEERFMTTHFPEQYPAYMKRTKALIPWVF